MGKSIRSKAKRKARIIKRTDSHYAVADAERVQRLNARLMGKEKLEKEGDEEEMKVEEGEEAGEDAAMNTDESTPAKISTSGPRNSRRELWRTSKGMPARPLREGVNRQGQAKGKRKPGRPARRR